MNVLVEMFTNGWNVGLSLRVLSQKRFFGMERHGFYNKEKALSAVFSKFGHAHSLLERERNPDFDFPEKDATLKKCFLLSKFGKILRLRQFNYKREKIQ